MLLVLSGKTCSGKTTVQEKLMKEFGCRKIVTYTTRPMRPGEKDGETYNFLSEEEFFKKREEGFFLETAEYNTLVDNVPATWYYGSAKEDFAKASASDDIYVIILQQAGLGALKQTDIPYTAVYLEVSDETILARQSGRNDNETEAKRRIAADREAFIGIGDLVDATVTVDDVGVEEAARLVLNVAGCLTAYRRTHSPSEIKSGGRMSFSLCGGLYALKEVS